MVDFSVNDDVLGVTLVVFSNTTSSVGIGPVREISRRMDELNARDTILVAEGLTPSASTEIRKLMNDGKFIVDMTSESLKFDICDHASVPPHRRMSDTEKKRVVAEFGAVTYFPRICMDDPVVKYYGAHPGDMFEITRNRVNVGEHPYYRLVTFD
jgi:DNA-directed RNA polymerase subunit H (RpoH/RPB5)